MQEEDIPFLVRQALFLKGGRRRCPQSAHTAVPAAVTISMLPLSPTVS